jgi:hypothetical protein
VREEKAVIVGIAGPAGVGKTTIAKLFCTRGYIILSFATPLKESLSVLTGMSIENFIDAKLKEKKIPGLEITFRKLMQKCATDFVRDMVYYNFWTWRMGHAIADAKTNMIVIDDIRFENEAALVRELGGKVIHLKRDFKPVTTETEHKSEKGIIEFPDDLILDCNIGKIEAFTKAYSFVYPDNNK